MTMNKPGIFGDSATASPILFLVIQCRIVNHCNLLIADLTGIVLCDISSFRARENSRFESLGRLGAIALLSRSFQTLKG